MQQRSWYNIFVVIVLVLLGSWLWQRGSNPSEEPTQEEIQLESRVNKFLETSGVDLPAGIERANLSGPNDDNATGVATKREVNDDTEYTILAAIPDISAGWYEGWLTDQDGSNPVSLGRLRISKGGYILEKVSPSVWQDKLGVIVTQEQVIDKQPEEIVLEGSF